jgi:PKD repeat protein
VTTLNGKILRLNKDGSIPSDNPTSFTSTSGATLTPTGSYRAIWAIGLRNPYRFSFSSSGAMRINDVGGGAFEEVNVGVAGANYGWPTCEGLCSNPFARNPIYAHVRGPDPNEGCAITGGTFQSGSMFPTTYADNYFVIDYCRTWLRHLRTDNSFGTFPLTIPSSSVDLKFAPDGSLYVLGHGSGVVSRITYAGVGGNRDPVAQATANPTSGAAPLAVSFSAAGSSDPDGDPLSYAWTFGDGGTATGISASHTYASGTYTARLTVTDGKGGSATRQLTISAGNPPTATIASPQQGAMYSAGETITFSGAATDPDDGSLPPSAFSWTVLFHHDTHTHPAVGPINGTASGSFTIPATGHTEDTVFYRIYLTVTDSSGVQTQVTRDVVPRKARITLATNVAGAQVLIDGQPQTAPYTFTGVVGVQRTIAVTAPQTVNGQAYGFSSWSDGGAQSHVISTPTVDTTYTATLTPQTSSPAPPPTLHWMFDNNLNEAIRGTSTSGRGTIAYSTDRPAMGGNVASLSLDGTETTYVAIAGDQVLSGWSNATAAIWVKVTSGTATSWAANSSHTLLSKAAVLESRILKNSAGQLQFVVAHGDGTALGTAIVATAPIPVDSWVHLASVHQGTTLTLYVNGQAAGSAAVGRTLGAANNGTLNIVGHGGGFSGLLDDFRLHDSALTASQIGTLAGGSAPAPPKAPTNLRIIR